MHKKHKYDILVILSVVGFSISLFLTASKFLGVNVPCDLTGGCDTVLTSKYSEVVGVPLSVLGMAYFFTCVVLSLLSNHYPVFHKWLTGFLGLGAFMSMIFLSLQFFVIGKVCQYCLTVDILSIFIFLLDLNLEHKKTLEP